MSKPRLLDLFCGVGGCAMGYHRAGFDVVGVDIAPQPRYPFEFVKAGALEFLKCLREADEIGDALSALNATGGLCLSDFAVIHASPPCQGYSRMRHLPWLKGKKYPMMISDTIDSLERSGKPWVVENVEDAGKELAKSFPSVMLCGTMFGLKVYRHRLFCSNQFLWQPDHPKHKVVIGGKMLNDRSQPNADGWVSLPSREKRNGLRNLSGGMVAVAGHSGYGGDADAGRRAMGIDWMNRNELSQAIPPAYTEYIGKQLFKVLNGENG